VIWYLGQWFPADHRGRAVSRFYVSAPLGSLVMSGLAAVLLGLDGRMGLSGWQWLFLIEGLPAIVMSAVFLVFLPDSLERADFLSTQQKAWIASELDREAPAARAAARTFRAILCDRHVLQLAAINALSLGSYYAFSLSAPVLLQQSAHLDLTHLAWLMAAPNLAGAIGMLANSWHSDRTGERFLHYAVPIILVGLAYAVWLAAPLPPVIMAAYCAAVIFYFTPLALYWSLAGKFIAPPERAVAYAVINSGGMIGSFLGPVLFGYARDHTGGYALGMAALPVCLFAAAAITIGMRRQDAAALPALPEAAAV
jgi:ACS family tartrate transporter-like MFS transporter